MSSRRHRTLAERGVGGGGIKAYRHHHTHHRMNKAQSEGDDGGGADGDGGDATGTPTPSEKVSRWHRDIFLVSPTQQATTGHHPRQCLCQQCLAEYGTFKMYNEMLGEKETTTTTTYDQQQDLQQHQDKEQHQQPQGGERRRRRRRKFFLPYMCGKAEQALFSRTSSTSGTVSSLRISKTRARCTERRWFICVSLAMIFTVCMASAGIFFGYRFLRSHLPETESVFRGHFRVTSGDYLPQGVAEPGSHEHLKKATFYQHKLDLIFTGSHVAKGYLHSEVFLLEGFGSDGLKVHFNVHLDPEKYSATPEDIAHILKEEIRLTRNSTETNEFDKSVSESLLGQLVIDEESVEIHERSNSAFSEGDPSPTSNIPTEESLLENRDERRQCIPFQVEFCKLLPYNFTTFPNALGHRDAQEAKRDIERFKEVVDSKCYSLSYEFLCQLLQPVCFQQKMVLPCRDFCQEFVSSCGHLMVGGDTHIDCNLLATEADGPGACISKPGCVTQMRTSGFGARICDGVVDCPDFSDELYCPYCPEHHFHCGVGKKCIHKEKMWDGVQDCQNGADEKGRMSLVPRMDVASYIHQYYPSGYLVYHESGETGKVCADHFNRTVSPKEMATVLEKLGTSMCAELEFAQLDDIHIQVDVEDNPSIRYVDMVGPTARRSNYVSVPCPLRQVLHLTCAGPIACGQRPAYNREHATDVVQHGDWPWHVTLYKNGVHACDGALVGQDWVMTTKACFQGQGRAKWVARMASIRPTSRAPWEQRRRIVGMVSSPVEDNSIVLLKLDQPVALSDFTRPICLPASDHFIHLGATCVVLSWDTRDKHLRVVPLEPADRQKCAKDGDVAGDAICTQETEPNAKCQGEEFAGSALMCQTDKRWHLVGISAWRQGCTPTAKRPKLYDRVVSNTQWAMQTMQKIDQASSQKR